MGRRVERTRAGGRWTESHFFGFVRSGLRAKHSRFPPRFDVLNDAKRTVKGKRHKYEYQCARCKNWFKQTEVQVDHIVPCGTLKKWEDLPEFARKLFCEKDGLQVLCKAKCHQEKTQEDRKNV